MNHKVSNIPNSNVHHRFETKPESVWELLGYTPCSDLVEGQHPVVLDSKLPIEEACEVLSRHHILSAPVMEDTSYIGFFDYADAIAYLLGLLKKESNSMTLLLKQDKNDVKHVVQCLLNELPLPVRYVTDMSLRDPFYSLLPESSLLQALEVLGCKDGVRRLAICGGSDTPLLGILSQSDMIRFLASNLETIGWIAERPVKEISELGTDAVITAQLSDSVIDVVRLMHEKNISSVALVNDQHHLISSMSISDIRYIFQSKMFSMLFSPCSEMLSLFRDTRLFPTSAGSPISNWQPRFNVNPDTKLQDVLRKFVATQTHRLWVTDENEHPIGVISMIDVLEFIRNMSPIET